MDEKKPAQNPTGTPTDTANEVTTESESRASENPHPLGHPDVVVEKPAQKTREEAAKAVKDSVPD
jgi:hypothetical protein